MQLHNSTYYPWLVFGVTAIGTFMATLDSSILNVALPVIAADFAVGLDTVQWAVTAYLLAICSLLLLFGRAGDIYGRRRVYATGFVIFTLGSLLCGVASGIWLLVAARVIQAVGASMLMANAQGIVTATFTGPERGRALGLTSTMVGLGSLTGPGLGGLLIDAFGWRSVFFVNLPIGILGFMASKILPANRPAASERMDIPGAIIFAGAMVAFLLVLNQGDQWGWLTVKTLTGIAVAFCLFVLFWVQEHKTEQPLVDLTLFQNRPFLFGIIAALLTFMAMSANSILLPFFMHSVLAFSVTQMGLVMTAFPVMMATVAPISGYLSERVNHALLTACGLTIMTAGLLYHIWLDQTATLSQVFIGQAIMGLGNGMFQSPNNNSIMSSVPTDKLGIAGGVNALIRNVGMVSGVALAVALFEYLRRIYLPQTAVAESETAAFLAAYRGAVFVAAVLAGFAAIISALRPARVPVDTGK